MYVQWFPQRPKGAASIARPTIPRPCSDHTHVENQIIKPDGLIPPPEQNLINSIMFFKKQNKKTPEPIKQADYFSNCPAYWLGVSTIHPLPGYFSEKCTISKRDTFRLCTQVVLSVTEGKSKQPKCDRFGALTKYQVAIFSLEAVRTFEKSWHLQTTSDAICPLEFWPGK